jgi:hypothetical protein
MWLRFGVKIHVEDEVIFIVQQTFFDGLITGS